jgi:hypothetical protein
VAAPAEAEPLSAPPPSFGRLLRFAAPEAPWIALGLLSLLARLPFSLAMPHFVSVALGRVLVNDYAAAQARKRTSVRSSISQLRVYLPRCNVLQQL